MELYKWLRPADGILDSKALLSQIIPYSVITEVKQRLTVCLQRESVAQISHLLSSW